MNEQRSHTRTTSLPSSKRAAHPCKQDTRPEIQAGNVGATPTGSAISTAYWPKPIPDRRSDWTAVLDNYEPGHPIGEGSTEAEAIADLRAQLTDEEQG